MTFEENGNCPFCNTPIKADDRTVTCAACNKVHHADCWEMNGGCTTAGCNGIPKIEEISAPIVKTVTCSSCGKVLPEGAGFCSACGKATEIPKTVTCSSCGKVLPEGAIFCSGCGKSTVVPKTVTCVSCGKILPEGAGFCSGCGTELIAPKKTVCQFCGEPLPEGVVFCSACGHTVTVPMDVASQVDTPKKSGSALPVVLSLVGVFAAVLIGILLYWVITPSTEELLAEGNYEKAYESAEGHADRTAVLMENLAAVATWQAKQEMLEFGYNADFRLRNAWADVSSKRVVLEVSGYNTFSGESSVRFLVYQVEYGSNMMLKRVYDDRNLFEASRDALQQKLSDSGVQNINNLNNSGELWAVVLLDENYNLTINIDPNDYYYSGYDDPWYTNIPDNTDTPYYSGY